MFLDFFLKLKDSKIPVSLNEFLVFLKALEFNFIQYSVDNFYYLARTCLIKDEKLIDKFDIIFGEYFGSIEKIEIEDVLKFLNIPNDWLKKLFDKNFSSEEINKIKSIGDFDKLIETLKKRLMEQKKRHQGGNKWIGTLGTSPFGSYGYNPEGIRIGQHKSIHRKAIKVWDKRNFKDFDDTQTLDNRGFQVALKRLRQWARTGSQEEFDIEETIRDTAKNGYLDIKTRKEKENSIKILLFLDVGGSMDDHIQNVEKLFNAARNVFKNLNYFYFHNCIYEGVWKNNSRRWEERFSTEQIIRTYGKEYKCIFVGDAAMSPYEILMLGGGNEHFNDETGKVWLERLISKWPSCLWINPNPEEYWESYHSTEIIKEIFNQRMVPLTIKGIKEGTRILKSSNFTN
tara:strand:- start:156 stop:1355 length:1200 start_codon:yes stop_codon:yes gene_type:complete